MNRGYFGVGVYHPKTETNIGTLWRSSMNFGALFLFTIGKRYRQQASDTVKAIRHIPLYYYNNFEEFNYFRPYDCQLVGVEQSSESVDIKNYCHPERAIYLLGAEDSGIPMEVQAKCQRIIHLSTPMCLNVAVAGSIVMFDRSNKNE